MFHIKEFDYLESIPINIVFRFQDGTSVSLNMWRVEFNDSLRFIDVEPKYLTWRVNSLTHGEITDQIAPRVKFEDVHKFAIHAINSKSTWIYTHLTSKEEADIRFNIQIQFSIYNLT